MASLCKLDYPIYACEVLDSDHVIVGGGGGSSKTGVPNVVDVLKIEKHKRNVQADPVERQETGKMAVMNMCVLSRGKDKPFFLAAGLGGTCKIYSVECKLKSAGDSYDKTMKNRKPKAKNDIKTDESATEHFSFSLLKTLETDFSADDPLQKAVRISLDGKIIATGGSDGYVRVWSMSDFTKKFYAKGHKDDVTDVDISPDGKHIVSVSRDGSAIIWNSENGMKELDLHSKWNSQMTTRNYRFRSCRYGTVIEDPKTFVLFTTHCPIRPGRRSDTKAPQGCITKWARKKLDSDASSGPLSPSIVQYTGREAISSMCVSKDGVFLGLGFMEGSVSIYIAFSLQCAKRIENVHSIFVTGLTFLPPTEKITGPCDAALVSVSADNHCKLIKLSSRTYFPMWLAILLIFLSLAAAAVFMYHFGII